MAMTAEKISAGREVGEGRGAVCIARLEELKRGEGSGKRRSLRRGFSWRDETEAAAL